MVTNVYPSLSNSKNNADVYSWHLSSSWLSTAGSIMFPNVPAGSYKLVINFGWESSTVHSKFNITGPGFSHGVAFGKEDGTSSNEASYIERTVYLKSTSAGDWRASSDYSSGAGGVLRPSASLIRVYD